MKISRRMPTAKKTANIRVKLITDNATATFVKSFDVTIQLHQLGCRLARKSSKSAEIHQETAATTTDNTLPMVVRFFQSEDNVEETVIRVLKPVAERLQLIIFLALRGEEPQIEPCVREINFEGSSLIIVQPFWSSKVFKFT
jgi:hypothetical protein